MRAPAKILIGLVLLIAALLIAGSVPWTSRTVVDMTVADESGRPIPGASVKLMSGAGGVLAEGTTNEAGVLVLSIYPDPQTDWGKHVWRFDIFINGYVANETPISMSETRVGTIRAWLPSARPGDEKPHLRFLIKARIVCRKIL